MKLKEGLILREEGQEGLLFEQETGCISILNYLGLNVAKMLEKETSIDKITTNIKSLYKEQKPKKILSDVEEFLNCLRTQGLLVE